MNYPFFVYPGYPFRGYFNFEEYLSEVIRLDKYIQELKDTCTQNTLLHLTIGAAMEEVADIEDYFKIYIQKQHWRQLFPDFIDYNCFKNKTPVKIIIIAPNDIFSINNFKEPQFIKYTNEIYSWEKINQKQYKSQNFNVEVNFFCTMMPHSEPARNINIVNKIKQIDLDQKTNYHQKIIQSNDDLNFINQFYTNLKLLFDVINQKEGIVTCFSFAVFNEITEQSKYNEYLMFSEILGLFTKENEKIRLICRWIFNIKNNTMIVYSDKGFISYCYQTKDKRLFLEFDSDHKLNLVIR